VKFNFELQTLKTDALTLEFFEVPWDSELLERPVAQLNRIEIRRPERAFEDIATYQEWKDRNGIAFATARVPHTALQECALLQSIGYRFIELNYRPEIQLQPLMDRRFDEFRFLGATEDDQEILVNMAGRAFSSTRFHMDSRLGPSVGAKRYRIWMENAFERSSQEVLKCEENGEILAFFIQERPQEHHVFWSLVALAPEKQGRGFGRKVWESLLRHLRANGVTQVSTSISSLNFPMLNLYVQLGFRFPEPEIILHWHRSLGT
jgi:ribosomal protein S18 acetylase RimI-like enzyme